MANKNMKDIVRGSSLFFLNSAVLMIFGIIYKVVVARYLGPSDFGLFSLGFMAVGIASVLSLVGLQSALKRYIPHYTAKGDESRLKGIVVFSFMIALGLSLLIAAVLFLFSDYIAINVFGSEAFPPILRIFSLGIPLTVLLRLLAEAFLGFKKVEFNVLTELFSKGVGKLILALAVVFAGGSIVGLSYAYILALLLGAALGLLILEFKVFPVLRSKAHFQIDKHRILSFSLPLFLASAVGLILGWSDTFMIGVMLEESAVGLYNAAYPLGMMLSVFVPALASVFMPVASELYAKQKLKEIAKIFDTTKRWLAALVFPVFVFVLFFSENLMRVVFGEAYAAAWPVLIALSFGGLVLSVVGLTCQLLMVFEETKKIVLVGAAGASINLVLNFILIPMLGILGAGIASAFSLCFINIGMLVLGRKLIEIRFNPRDYAKLVGASALAVVPPFLLSFFIASSLFTLILFGVLYLGLYLLFIFLFRVPNKDDLVIAEIIENKANINLSRVKQLIPDGSG